MTKSCAPKTTVESDRTASVGVCAAFTLFVSLSCTATDIYKWTDDDGEVHYGDKPLGGNADVLTIKSQQPEISSRDHARQDKTRRLLDSFAEERQERQQAREKAIQDKLEREQKCAKARERLVNYERAGFLYDEDEQGNRRVLSDEEHDKAFREAREYEQAVCAN